MNRKKSLHYCISETCMRFDVELVGIEISKHNASSDLLCQEKCFQTPGCRGFTWNNDDMKKQCTLFSQINNTMEAQSFVSGLRHCGNLFF